MKIRHSRQSRQDVTDIGRHIHKHNPVAALKVRAEIQDILLMPARHPEAGRAIGRGLRRFALPRLPYLIIYRIDGAADAVQIATIRHTSRQPVA